MSSLRTNNFDKLNFHFNIIFHNKSAVAEPSHSLYPDIRSLKKFVCIFNLISIPIRYDI